MRGNSATLKKSAERRCSSRERARGPLSLSPVPTDAGLDVELDGAGLRRAVERELARVLVEASEDRGEAEVVQREVRERVVRVDVVVLDRGEGRQRQRGGEGDA
jgi:hypothetical protein